jgi:hypothetical protein
MPRIAVNSYYFYGFYGIKRALKYGHSLLPVQVMMESKMHTQKQGNRNA